MVTGREPARHAQLLDGLRAASVQVETFAVAREPTVELASEGVARARAFGADLVIGIGGGSALDAGKAMAALLTNEGDPLDFLEVIGRGQPLARDPAPYLAVPTTSGTGAEVTKNAVLKSQAHGVKVSLRSDRMLPDLALVDPDLTLTVPPAVTASTGLDALTQVLEPFVSHLRNPLTDGICREGMKRAARSLQRAYEDGQDVDARRDMALTSLFGGLALANAKLGAVHGFAGPLGGMFPSPHGAVCARLLPLVIEANVRALRTRGADPEALERYDEIGRILTGQPDARAEDAIRWTREIVDALRIPSLSSYGMGPEHLDTVIDKSRRSSSMKGNPIELEREELVHILERAL